MLVSLCDARASVCTYVGIPSVMREASGERLDVDPGANDRAVEDSDPLSCLKRIAPQRCFSFSPRPRLGLNPAKAPGFNPGTFQSGRVVWTAEWSGKHQFRHGLHRVGITVSQQE